MGPLTPFIAFVLGISPAQLTAPDGSPNAKFGAAVATSESHIIIGSPIESTLGYQAGAVYAYTLDDATWTFAQRIDPPSVEDYGNFGFCADLEGDTLVIGWPGGKEQGIRTGKVVVYQLTDGAWTPTHTLLDPEGENGDRFGTSVDLDEDLLIVGCQLDDTVGLDSGSGLIFRRVEDSWTWEGRLIPTEASDFAWAGRDVAIDGDLAVIGSYTEWNDEIQAAGAAYVYHRAPDGIWIQEARLTAEDPVAGNYFGFSVSLDDQRLAVGSILNDATSEDSGAVYLFQRHLGTWMQQKLEPPDEGGEFGYAVDVRGSDLLIGAVYHPGNGIASGAVYRFAETSDGWTWQGKWLPSPESDDCFYGAAIARGQSHAVVGAPRDDVAGYWSGATYVHALLGACPSDITGDVAVDVNDLLAVISTWGPCNACDADIDNDGMVGTDDLLAVLSAWGWCP